MDSNVKLMRSIISTQLVLNFCMRLETMTLQRVFCERLLDSFFETGRGGHFFSYMELRDAFSSTSNGSSRGGFGHFIKNLPETFKRRLYKDVPQKETLGATQILIKRV